MSQLRRYESHTEKRRAIASVAREFEHKRLSFSTSSEPLRNEFLRLASLQEEVITAVKILIETDEQILRLQLKADEAGASGDLLGQLKQQGSKSTAEAWTRMSLSWKILFYSVRCFQDSVYRAIICAQLESSGIHASMSACVKDGEWRGHSSVGRLIAETLPAYPRWFIHAREIRNALKKGLSVQSVWAGGQEPEHFIVLCAKRWNGQFVENTEEYPLRFQLVLESLKMCMAVADLIPIAYEQTKARKLARKQRIAEKAPDFSK